MGLGEQTFITFALSIDSFFMMAFIALAHRNFKLKSFFYLNTIFLVACIQTLFAFIGHQLGHELLQWIQYWDHWVVFIFFSYLAWKQWSFDPAAEYSLKKLTYLNIVLLSVMCSIDALIVTIPLVDLFWSFNSYFLSIFLFTLLLAAIAPLSFHLIKKSNMLLSSKVAAVLIFILGCKILYEHLG
jgi:putative Mn2+ efflux pump MntP